MSDAESLAAELVAALRERGWSVGVAESLTGGLVCAALVSVAGASAVVRGGVVAYQTPLKHELLGVDAALLAAHGAVHPLVAEQMALGIRRAVTIDGRGAELGIATTGIAGPTSPDGQPVGTVHVGISTPARTFSVPLLLAGDRGAIRSQSVGASLRAARDAVWEYGM